MTVSVTAYHNLQISPYELTSLKELTLTKKLNEHVRLQFTGIVSEEVKDRYVATAEAKSPIEVWQLDPSGNRTPLFNGIVLNIEVRSVRDVYYLEIEAVSHTYDLDVQQKSRSFQYTDMTYGALFKQVGADYPGIDILDEVTNGGTLGTFTMQHKETDWQFLKRMASRFHTGLVPAALFDKPKFYFGIPEGQHKGNLEDYHYTITKNIAHYLKLKENDGVEIDENDCMYYTVETDRILEIGDQITFKAESLYVFEAVTKMKDGLLKHSYTLSSKNGMSQKKTHNHSIIGLSIEGKVLEVAKDHVKIHLDIDQTQNKNEAYWFPYATTYSAEGHSGWYCMPEVNDTVRVYFPTNQEEDGIANSSVRKNTEDSKTNKLSDPNIKYFRTAFGKELMMSPKEIVITAQDGDVFIRLNEDNGIEIYSKKEIKVISDQDISLNASSKIMINAKERIHLSCKESTITLDGDTQIYGKEVKTN